MKHYNLDKMVPVEAVAAKMGYVIKNGKMKALRLQPQTKDQKRTIKDHHTKKARTHNKLVAEQEKEAWENEADS